MKVKNLEVLRISTTESAFPVEFVDLLLEGGKNLVEIALKIVRLDGILFSLALFFS